MCKGDNTWKRSSFSAAAALCCASARRSARSCQASRLPSSSTCTRITTSGHASAVSVNHRCKDSYAALVAVSVQAGNAAVNRNRTRRTAFDKQSEAATARVCAPGRPQAGTAARARPWPGAAAARGPPPPGRPPSAAALPCLHRARPPAPVHPCLPRLPVPSFRPERTIADNIKAVPS